MSWVFKGLAYTAWGIVMLLLMVYLRFPTELLNSVVQTQIQNIVGPSYTVHVDDTSLDGLTGITVEGIRINPVFRPTPQGEESDGAPVVDPPTLIPEAVVTVNPLSLMGPQIELSAEIRFAVGSLFAVIAPHPEDPAGHQIDVDVQGVNIGQIGFLSKAMGAAMTGTANGQATILTNAQWVITGGEINFAVAGLERAAGAFQQATLVTPTRFGTLTLEAALNGSDLQIRRFETSGGEDMELRVSGELQIRSPASASNLFLDIQVGFSEEWKNDNDLARPIAEFFGAFCDAETNQCALQFRGPAGTTRARPPVSRR